MRSPSRRERIAAQLADLKMPGALESLDEVLAGTDSGGTMSMAIDTWTETAKAATTRSLDTTWRAWLS